MPQPSQRAQQWAWMKMVPFGFGFLLSPALATRPAMGVDENPDHRVIGNRAVVLATRPAMGVDENLMVEAGTPLISELATRPAMGVDENDIATSKPIWMTTASQRAQQWAWMKMMKLSSASVGALKLATRPAMGVDENAPHRPPETIREILATRPAMGVDGKSDRRDEECDRPRVSQRAQ